MNHEAVSQLFFDERREAPSGPLSRERSAHAMIAGGDIDAITTGYCCVQAQDDHERVCQRRIALDIVPHARIASAMSHKRAALARRSCSRSLKRLHPPADRSSQRGGRSGRRSR